ncbi:MAG: hypothetical protein JNL60_18710 [Bacteroidia bacterium]|nr:hypothetical protein [Bacteroidia bacterium]
MSDKLKDFIADHREEFDTRVPKDLWPAIESAIHKKPFINPKTLSKMFKYGFGASALVIGTLVVLNVQKEKQPVTQNSKTGYVSIEKAQPKAFTVTKEENPTRKNAAKELPMLSAPPIDTSVDVLPEDKLITENKMPEEEPQTYTGSYKMIASYGTFHKSRDKDTSLGKYFVSIDTVFSGVSRLQIISEYCNVNIKAAQTDVVNMSGKVGGAAGNVICLGTRSYMNKVNVCRYEKKDSVLKIWIEGKDLGERIKMTKDEKEKSELNLTVPINIKVDIDNSAGNINLSGIESSGVNLKTGYGHITVQDVKTNLKLNSGSGNIFVKNQTGIIKAISSYGHQTLEDLNGDAVLRSGSGNIHLKNLKGNLEITSSFGHQNITDIQGDVKATLSSGNLKASLVKGNVTVKSSFGKQSFNEVEGNITSNASSGSIVIDGFKGALGIGTSFGNIIGKNITLISNSEFKTSSGSINMEFKNEMKDLRFDLSASSGRMLIEKDNVKNTSDHTLMVGDGKILVKGITSFGNQNYH